VSTTLQRTREKSALFDTFEVPNDRREITYLTTYLSCWLCTFVLTEDEKRFMRPRTFEVASNVVVGCTFSLIVPVLASIYRGLNSISSASKPSNSISFFPADYVYGWLACYFNTHYVLDNLLAGSLMAHYSDFGGAKSFDDAQKRIHKGTTADLGCTMLSKNKYEILNDDRTLGYEKLSYLIALHPGILPFRHRATFCVVPIACIDSADNLGSGRMYLVHIKSILVLGPYPTVMPYIFRPPFCLRAPSP